MFKDIAKTRRNEALKTEKSKKAKEAVEKQAGLLKPQEALTGLVKQVLRDQKQENKPHGGAYEIDYLNKFVDEQAGIANPSEHYIKKRRFTKQELSKRKELKSKNGQSQGLTLGTVKPNLAGKSAQQTAKGKGKTQTGAQPQASTKGESKGKSKMTWPATPSVFHDPSPKGKGKGKTGKGAGKHNNQKGKGKGKKGSHSSGPSGGF